MTRFGKLIVALLLLAGIGFVAMVRIGGGAPAAPRAAAAPVAAPRLADTAMGAGALTMPVAGVLPAALVDTFRQARGQGRVHDAIDIMAPRGTPVLAAAGGTIEKLFDSERGGHTIYIRSPDRNWVHYYAHLDRYVDGVREGLYVPAGQAIATVGSTGDARADGPHLHFEVKRMGPRDTWWQGTAIDPYPLLGGR